MARTHIDYEKMREDLATKHNIPLSDEEAAKLRAISEASVKEWFTDASVSSIMQTGIKQVFQFLANLMSNFSNITDFSKIGDTLMKSFTATMDDGTNYKHMRARSEIYERLTHEGGALGRAAELVTGILPSSVTREVVEMPSSISAQLRGGDVPPPTNLPARTQPLTPTRERA